MLPIYVIETDRRSPDLLAKRAENPAGAKDILFTEEVAATQDCSFIDPINWTLEPLGQLILHFYSSIPERVLGELRFPAQSASD